MAKFTYLVTVEVPDEPQQTTQYEVIDFYGDPSLDHTQKFSAPKRADIVMAERLGCDEDYGFKYTVDYEVAS